MRIVISAMTVLALSVPSALAAEADELKVLRGQVEEVFGNEFSIVAVCGSSTGKVIYQDQLEMGWQDDAISGGRLVFMTGPGETRDVIYQDATGRLLSASQEGGTVVELFSSLERAESVWLVTYGKTGVTETYTLSHPEGGSGYLYWSSAKPSVEYPTTPPRTIGPKVSSFVSRCF